MVKSQRVTRLAGKGQRAIKKLLTWQKTAAARSAAVGGVVGFIAQANHVNAASYTWDPGNSQSASFGGGSWNTTAANTPWYNGVSGPDVVWTQGNTATFGGTNPGGTSSAVVTVNGTNNVSVGGITFNTAGYSINGTLPIGALSFSVNGAIINGAVNANINAPMVGTNGFAYTGSGNLSLGSGAVQYLGGITASAITVSSGTVTLTGGNNTFLPYSGAGITNAGFTSGIAAPTLSIAAAGTLDVQGNNEIFSASTNATTVLAGTLTNSSTASPAVITFVSASPGAGTGTGPASVNLSGVISGSNSVVVDPTSYISSGSVYGASVVNVSNAQTYTVRNLYPWRRWTNR